jgi:hypothetical protein
LAGARVLGEGAFALFGEPRMTASGRFCFRVEVPFGETRVLVCEVEGEADCLAWVEAIRAAVPPAPGDRSKSTQW